MKGKGTRRRRGRKPHIGFVLLCLALLAAFCFAAFNFLADLWSARREKGAFEELAAIVEANRRAPDAAPAAEDLPWGDDAQSADAEPAPDDNGSAPLPQYLPLYEMNADFFGWISIEDSKIDYPVMYTPDRPEYYIKRAFDGSAAAGGVPFIDSRCPADGNFYLIYGHNMRNKTMFGDLPKYARQNYLEEHPIIRFDTLYEERQYRVIAAFYSRVYAEDEIGAFRYYDYADLRDAEIFAEYIRQLRIATIYDAGFDAEYGDELLALSTCSYHTDDGRFVVVAKRIDNAD